MSGAAHSDRYSGLLVEEVCTLLNIRLDLIVSLFECRVPGGGGCVVICEQVRGVEMMTSDRYIDPAGVGGS